jgi:hypothetical protein
MRSDSPFGILDSPFGILGYRPFTSNFRGISRFPAPNFQRDWSWSRRISNMIDPVPLTRLIAKNFRRNANCVVRCIATPTPMQANKNELGSSEPKKLRKMRFPNKIPKNAHQKFRKTVVLTLTKRWGVVSSKTEPKKRKN